MSFRAALHRIETQGLSLDFGRAYKKPWALS